MWEDKDKNGQTDNSTDSWCDTCPNSDSCTTKDHGYCNNGE